MNYFQQALDRDPTYADSAAGAGFAYDLPGEDYYMPAPVAFEQEGLNPPAGAGRRRTPSVKHGPVAGIRGREFLSPEKH
jgi:hypothetical protein